MYWGSNFKSEFGWNWLTDEPSGALVPFLWPKLQPLWVPTVAVLVYVFVLYAGQLYMKNREMIDTPKLLFWHNIILTVISVFLAGGGLYTAVFIGRNYSLYDMYCGVSDEIDGPLLNWGNYFYLSKYYELFDTVFLVMRKKELTFLHLFHHIIVVFTCWFAVHEHQIMGWITCVNNATVHVFMYWYFAWRALGQEIWWRKLLTRFQMIQFVIDIVTSIPFLYLWFIGARCRGSIWSWLNAVLVGMFLWLLFNNFFQRTYHGKPKKPSGAAAAVTPGSSASSAASPASEASATPTEVKKKRSKKMD